jgi:hypothetical protein
VQPKAVAFPTDAKLMHRPRERLVKLAHKTGVSLRQSYERVGKHALIVYQRYAHAKQFKRANRALKTIRTYLGRVIRDIVRKIEGEAELESVLAHPLMLARRVREQRQHQRGKKIYSLHAPEVECIGKGKAHRPYEFGVKVSLATTLHRSRGGQLIAHAKALPGNPYDGHTLATAIRRSRHRSAPTSPASSPTAAIAATTPRPTTSSSLYLRPETPRHRNHQARTPPPIGGRTGHRPRQGRAPHGTISPAPIATPPTPSSPPPDTISAGSSPGSLPFGVPSSWRSSPTPETLPSQRQTAPEVHRSPTLRRTSRCSRSTLKRAPSRYKRRARSRRKFAIRDYDAARVALAARQRLIEDLA